MILAIIQARMNSSRLKGKVLVPLMDKPVIAHIINRVSLSKHINEIVVATTVSPLDDPLVSYLQNELKCKTFRGSESDVLDRFYNCALEYKCDIIVRITADDPLKDPKIIDIAIEHMIENPELDYCSNTIDPSYPEGIDVEVMKFSALKKAYLNAKKPSEREHVTPYIWSNAHLFNLKNFRQNEDMSSWRWTLDKPEDLIFFKTIYEIFYNGNSYFPYENVVEHIKNNPELLSINSGTTRNEGYLNSISKESCSNEHN